MPPIDLAYLHDAETQTTDEKSGGRKGVKLTSIGALDPVALMILGRVAGMGAQKYAPFNFLQGFDWSKLYNAGQRHRNLFWAGEDTDSESGLPHIAHAAWMDMALLSFWARAIGQDDRPPRLAPPMCHAHPLGEPHTKEPCGHWCYDPPCNHAFEAASGDHGQPYSFNCTVPGCDLDGHHREPSAFLGGVPHG